MSSLTMNHMVYVDDRILSFDNENDFYELKYRPWYDSQHNMDELSNNANVEKFVPMPQPEF